MNKAVPITILDSNNESNDVGLPLKRNFLWFTASDISGYVDVMYEEYYQSPSGKKLNRIEKVYRVTGTKFDQWDNHLLPSDVSVGDFIRTAINNTMLHLLPLNAENGYIIQ